MDLDSTLLSLSLGLMGGLSLGTYMHVRGFEWIEEKVDGYLDRAALTNTISGRCPNYKILHPDDLD